MKKWDGRWRVLSFDIPRDLRSKRYEYLRQLHRLGFEKVLQSMWVYPFPCEKELKKISTSLGLGEDIFYMEVTLDSENHEHLKKHFAYLLR
jgi:DNA-binding transcriptional regulator PaaX